MMVGMTACDLCPNGCRIEPGGVGLCKARGVPMQPGADEPEREPKLACASDTGVVALNYGKIASIALDPIEKKPLHFFHPGKKILSVGSFGCNLRCPWCQNYRISTAGENDVETKYISPELLAELAEEHVPLGSIGVAFTYNEPLVGFEYIIDTSKILKQRGLKSVLVTNGYANPDRFDELLPYVDAMNIDLKSIRPEFYKQIGGALDVIKRNIEAAHKQCHIELTCLLLGSEKDPDIGMTQNTTFETTVLRNDAEEEMEEMAAWIASVSDEIPFHISRYFPGHEMKEGAPTEIAAMERFREIAERHLKRVRLGNV